MVQHKVRRENKEVGDRGRRAKRTLSNGLVYLLATPSRDNLQQRNSQLRDFEVILFYRNREIVGMDNWMVNN